MKMIGFLCLLVIMTGIATAPWLVAQQETAREKTQERLQPQLPSMAETHTISFDGRLFDLKPSAKKQSVPSYEYFLPDESASHWTELVSFLIMPEAPNANKPVDHAVRMSKIFKQTFPFTQCDIYTNDKSGETVLDCLVPLPEKKEFEFDAFKFYTVGQSSQVLCFHYVNLKLKGPDGSRSYQDAKAEIVALRRKILPMMSAFPPYRP
jgi:hypothetical protein